MDLLRYRFAVTHLLNKIEKLRDNSSNAATTCEEYDSVKRSQIPPHTTVRSIDESLIDMFWPLVDRRLKHFSGESTKWPEDQRHVSVLPFAEVGSKVVATQGSNGERVVLEDGNTGHPQIDVLPGSPLDLRRYRHLDGILGKDRHGSGITNE